MNRNDTQFIVQKIRSQYVEADSSKKELDMLRELDAEVKRPAQVFGYVFGIIGAIIMGAGMSLVMTDIGTILGINNAMTPGIVVGIIGMLMAIVNYPIYKKMLDNGKKKYAYEIVELAREISEGK